MFALALSVVLLGAAARHSQFIPQSDPAHFLSNASKMNVSYSSLLPVVIPVIPTVLPLQPGFFVIPIVRPEEFAASQIARILCLQHRSPPFSL
jgi:hypothetical protein